VKKIFGGGGVVWWLDKLVRLENIIVGCSCIDASSISVSLRMCSWCMYEKEKEGRRVIKYSKTLHSDSF
jgi:hypothetical protein